MRASFAAGAGVTGGVATVGVKGNAVSETADAGGVITGDAGGEGSNEFNAGTASEATDGVGSWTPGKGPGSSDRPANSVR